ncbi:MAG: hypothetical protein E1N59_1055 [Puniceicoccaceae bacterium 5H]|nr:MAG: hypothetical protein E1N59_1055 [Puniceicoccaceae bacterium 5H]
MTLSLVVAVMFLVSCLMLVLNNQIDEGIIQGLYALALGLFSLVAMFVAGKVETELVKEAGRLLYILTAVCAIGISIPFALYLKDMIVDPEQQHWAIYCAGGVMAIGFLLRLIEVPYLRSAEEVREIETYLRSRRES